MDEKIINIKTAYNWRGDIAELLAKHQFNAKRTKGYDYSNQLLIPKHENFLKSYWNTIDLFRVNENKRLEIFEVKARTYGVKRRADLT